MIAQLQNKLILILVVAGLLTNIPKTNAAPMSVSAVEKLIKKMAGSTERINTADNKKGWSIDLYSTDCTDSAIEKITSLNNIVSLNLNETKVTDKATVSLRAMKSLQEIQIKGTDVSNEGRSNGPSTPAWRSIAPHPLAQFSHPN